MSAPAKEWKGRPIAFDGYLDLCRSWGLTGRDVFQPFVDAAGGPQRLAERLAAHGVPGGARVDQQGDVCI